MKRLIVTIVAAMAVMGAMAGCSHNTSDVTPQDEKNFFKHGPPPPASASMPPATPK